MKRDRVDLGSPPRRENLLEYIVDALEIYARCSEVFDYARDKPGATARRLEKGDIVSAVHNASLFSIYDDEIKRWAKAREEYLAANNGL